jgi:PAS domain S-box-containing protein
MEINLDITKRKQAENALFLASAYNRSLIEASLDPLVTITSEGKISDVNAATESITGFTRQELIGKDFSDYFTEPEKARAGYQKVFDESYVRDYPLQIRHKDGHATQVLYNASIYRDKGNVLGVFAAARDITAQLQLEEQLRQAHKMEAIGTLAGGIAHDFNNILAAILGFTEMAIDDAADGRSVDKSLKNVHKSALRARDLIKQILSFSRKTSYERAPVSLSPLIKEIVQLLRASIAANIEIKLAITVTSDTIFAAATEVQQILMNLATNASLAMEGAGGVLDISLSDIDLMPDLSDVVTDLTPGEYVQLTVGYNQRCGRVRGNGKRCGQRGRGPTPRYEWFPMRN